MDVLDLRVSCSQHHLGQNVFYAEWGKITYLILKNPYEISNDMEKMAQSLFWRRSPHATERTTKNCNLR
jgi:hypothetical protein